MKKIVLLACMVGLAVPSSAQARPCADYIDVYAIRTSQGMQCWKAHEVLKKLYKKGFNAAAGSRQLVQFRGDAYRCRWRNHRYGPLGTCRNLEGRGRFRGLMTVDV